MSKMKLDDILSLGKRDAGGNQIRESFGKDQSFNSIAALIGLEGRQKDPRVAPLLAKSIDMTPARQKGYLEQSLAQYAGELTTAVSGNLSTALNGFSDRDVLAGYLLESPLKPAKFGPSDDWNKMYSSAYSAHQFLKDPKDLGERMQTYVKNQVEGLLKDKVSVGLASAVGWVYESDPQLAKNAVVSEATAQRDKFVGALKLSDGIKYISSRFGTLKGDEKNAEAYRIGQAITETLFKVEAEKAKKKKSGK
ncbi:MAG: hypothetical protein ACP5NS_00615 [Candidatus Pacearchaeota archaeon]